MDGLETKSEVCSKGNNEESQERRAGASNRLWNNWISD